MAIGSLLQLVELPNTWSLDPSSFNGILPRQSHRHRCHQHRHQHHHQHCQFWALIIHLPIAGIKLGAKFQRIFAVVETPTEADENH